MHQTNKLKTIPPFGIYLTQMESQVPYQEQVHKSDSQSPRSHLGEPRPANKDARNHHMLH